MARTQRDSKKIGCEAEASTAAPSGSCGGAASADGSAIVAAASTAAPSASAAPGAPASPSCGPTPVAAPSAAPAASDARASGSAPSRPWCSSRRSSAATATSISAGCRRAGPPTSKVTAGMPALTAAVRSIPRLPGLCSTTVSLKPRTNASTPGSVRSARSCGRFMRSKLPVCRSTRLSQWRTTPSKKA